MKTHDKGKVESGVKYVKRNFLAGQTFADAGAANERVRRWVREVAGVRRHGTTQEAPLRRFEEQERRTLIPLPATAFDLVATHPQRQRLRGVSGEGTQRLSRGRGRTILLGAVSVDRADR